MIKDVLHASIDVGTSKICTLVARLRGDASPEILGAGVVPSQGVAKGIIVNIAEAQQSIKSAIDEASKSAGFPIKSAHVGSTGNNMEIFTRWGSVRSSYYNAPISRDVLGRAMESAYPGELPPERRVIHLIPQGYSIDGLKGVKNPIGMHALRLDVETLCIVGPATAAENLVRSVQGNGIEVQSIIMAGMATAESVLSRDEKETGVVLLEIGAGCTTVSVFQHGILLNAAVLPVGGMQFTTDLAVALSAPYSVAEEVKVLHGRATPEDAGDERVEIEAFGDRQTVKVERKEISRYLHDRAEEVLRLAHLKVTGFGLPNIPPAGVVLCGGAAKLPGIQKIARQVFACPIRIGLPEPLEGMPEGFQDPAYPASLGILLWGMRNGIQQGIVQKLNGNMVIEPKKLWTISGPLRWFKSRAKRVAL
jgi:cell division protein FtsA